jgi:class 3 adenylate cyclase
MAARIHYAHSGEAAIAYQVHGDGPLTVLTAPGFVSHLEVLPELPAMASALERLVGFARVIVFDKREQGLSDRVGRPPTIEEMVDDMRAVMDATDTERAALFGVSEGATMALMFAATYPERCTHLAIWGGYARLAKAPDYPEGVPNGALDAWGETIRREWGGPAAIEIFAPSRAGDPEVEDWWARLLRRGTSPNSALALMQLYLELDVRHALPLISAPTLILHRAGDRAVPIRQGRYLADHIEGARFVEIPGRDHLLWTEEPELILDEIEQFLTGTRREPLSERALATVMFTDIVDSTAHAARLGDRRWRQLLDRHDALARGEVERQRGRVVKMTGDGLLATFDGPGRAIECASRLVDGAPSLGLQLRAGLHTGECELRGEDVGGMAVHIGARVAGRAAADEVLVSSTVRDLVVGSGIEFSDRGEAELRGVPGAWRLYAVAGRG